MQVIRKVGDYQINEGSGMAKGLFNITDKSNDESLIATAQMRVSDWLDTQTKDELMQLSDADFQTECETILSN